MPWVYWNLLSTPTPLIICILRSSGGLRGKGADLTIRPGNLCRIFDRCLAASGLVSFRRTMVVGHQRCNVEFGLARIRDCMMGWLPLKVQMFLFTQGRPISWLVQCDSEGWDSSPGLVSLWCRQECWTLVTGWGTESDINPWHWKLELQLIVRSGAISGEGWPNGLVPENTNRNLQAGTLDPSIWNPPGKSRSEACDLTVLEAWRCPNSWYFLFGWNKALHLKDAGKNKKRGPELKCAALKWPIPWSTQRREHV